MNPNKATAGDRIHRHFRRDMKHAKNAGNSECSVKILDELDKLSYVWFQDPVLTVNNIKRSFMSRFF